ncbi:MAG: DNA-binding transcriptional regulator PaaX [Planctomycetota bacterium]
MAQLKIVYWRDIPGQVVVRKAGRSTRIRLSAKFMRAIERAAYRLKKKEKDALFEPWHDVNQPFNGNVSEQADVLVKHLEEHYTDDFLELLIRASGIDETRALNG